MTVYESEVLKSILQSGSNNQREISKACGCSLGVINKSLKSLKDGGYLDSEGKPTSKAENLKNAYSPKRAIILAAGFGMRMVPINLETPKALLEVKGKTLIERQIEQLHEVGVYNIHVVVGFMSEAFEFLIDEYGVRLITNNEYASKNNLHSMALVSQYLDNAYIIPCDIWCEDNPFSRVELNSWYMLSDREDKESTIRANRRLELAAADEKNIGNHMIGISYFCGEDSAELSRRLQRLDKDSRKDRCFWEEAMYEDGLKINAKLVNDDRFVEINTYEQLRDLDTSSNQLKSDAIEVIKDSLEVEFDDIVNIRVLKKGMTNRSFLFEAKGKKYIMRIPGEGTDQLINRAEEAKVYETIKELGICDNIIYINPENGYKITEYIEGVRVCDPLDGFEVKKCMRRLRQFHELELEVPHSFDILEKIAFYERLWGGNKSVYRDYDNTLANVKSLESYVDKCDKHVALAHIDAVPDNFLFTADGIKIIDWEYAGMQDTDVDIAMFSIYAGYDRTQVDHLIDAYYIEGASKQRRIKIYCYVSMCGLLWSNWCEYKRQLGVEFGGYALQQYRYAKEFYRIVQQELAEV